MTIAMPDVVTDTEALEVDAFPRLKQWVRDSLDKHGGWYKEAREAYDMRDGRQWSETEKTALLSTSRQPIVFNRIGPIIDSVCGMEVNNRQETKYLPRTQGDSEVDEKLTSLADWARDGAQAEDEESEAFRDVTTCGRGCTDTRIDFDEEPTGKIVVDRKSPLKCGVDPNSVKANFADRRFNWDYSDMDAADAEAMFEGHDARTIDCSWARTIDTQDGGEGNKRDYPDETRPGLRDGKPPKTVRVLRIQWWEKEKAYLVAHPQNPEPTEVSAEEWEANQAQLEGFGVTATRIDKRRYYQAFLGRGVVLEQTEIKCFTLTFLTGKRDEEKGWHYGLVRAMVDPSKLANKTLSQVLHILNSNAKGGLIMERGVFANARDAEKDWSDPSKNIIVNDGGIEKIKNREAPGMPPALVQLQEFAISSIRDVTGVSVEMLGLADRDQPASLEYQRRQSAMTILAALFDSLRRYRKTQGYVMLETLRLLPPGVLVRVIQDEDAEQAQAQQQAAGAQITPKRAFMPFDPASFGLSDESMRFDVIVDEAPTSPNQKEATWAAIQPFMASLPSSAVPIALKYSPLPLSAAQELGQAIAGAAQGPQIPPEVQQLIQQGQERLQQLEQENQALKQDRAIDAGKLQVAAQDAHTREMNVAAQAQHKQQQIELDYARLAQEIVRAQREGANFNG